MVQTIVPNFSTQMLQNKWGGRGKARGLFFVCLPAAKVGKVCELARELKFAMFASLNI